MSANGWRYVPWAWVLALLAAACAPEGNGQPADAWGSSDDPLPAGAVLVGDQEHADLVAAGNWFAVTPRTADETRQAEDRQDGADQATIADYLVSQPQIGPLVPDDPPQGDPTVVPTADGNFLHTVNVAGGTMNVVTQGRRWWLRTVAGRIRVFPTRENQMRAYRGLHDGLPSTWRTRLGLPSPDAVETDVAKTAGDILALNQKIADPANAAAIVASLAPGRIVIPPGLLTGCDQEIGAGAGGDLRDSKFDGTCDLSPSGIVKNHDWSLKPYLTCVKSQGNRGTCTAFASTSSIEMLVWKTHGLRVNLSEQAYYNRGRTKWDTPYGTVDGLMAELGFKGMRGEGFLLYFENQWNYNPSPQRATTCIVSDGSGGCLQASYQKSCSGYGETCSDTVHQSQLLCSKKDTWTYCGYSVPEKNPSSQGYRIGDAYQFWDPANKAVSLAAMQLALAMNYPLVLGHPITTAWDCAAAKSGSPSCAAGSGDGFLVYKPNDTSRGGHGSHVVGFIDNTTLASILPDAPPGAGGGYFIIKNSWGNCAGDGGFIYIPYQSILDYTGDVTVLFSVL